MVTRPLALTWKTALAALPSTASTSAPGPLIATVLFTNNTPVLSVMTPETPVASIVSPSFAIASACRNEPRPLSFVFVTGITVAWAEFPIKDSKATQIVANPAQNVILGLIEPCMNWDYLLADLLFNFVIA